MAGRIALGAGFTIARANLKLAFAASPFFSDQYEHSILASKTPTAVKWRDSCLDFERVRDIISSASDSIQFIRPEALHTTLQKLAITLGTRSFCSPLQPFTYAFQSPAFMSSLWKIRYEIDVTHPRKITATESKWLLRSATHRFHLPDKSGICGRISFAAAR
jgi:hypothetical protein